MSCTLGCFHSCPRFKLTFIIIAIQKSGSDPPFILNEKNRVNIDETSTLTLWSLCFVNTHVKVTYPWSLNNLNNPAQETPPTAQSCSGMCYVNSIECCHMNNPRYSHKSNHCVIVSVTAHEGGRLPLCHSILASYLPSMLQTAAWKNNS